MESTMQLVEGLDVTNPVNATRPSDSVSSRYEFISTSEAVNHVLTSEGDWKVTSTWSRRPRKSDPTKAMHAVTLTSDTLSFIDPRHDSRPVKLRCIISNSHDGTSGLNMFLGLFSFVCSNGLVVGRTEGGAIAARHIISKNSGSKLDIIRNSFNGILEGFKSLPETVAEMARTNLSEEERFSFARDCVALRYGADDPKVSDESYLDRLLLPCRESDEKSENSVWTTYNIVQEKLTKGWSPSVCRKQRGLVNMSRNIGLNMGLWNKATSLITLN